MLCSKTCLKWPLKKKTKIGFQDRLSVNAGPKYFRMLEHSAILSTFIKLPFVIKTFVFFFLFLIGRFRQVLLYLEGLVTSLTQTVAASKRTGTSETLQQYLDACFKLTLKVPITNTTDSFTMISSLILG